MPSNFDLPKTNAEDLGDRIAEAIDNASIRDQSPIVAQANAVRQYLKGDRWFDVVDPFNPSWTLLRIENPIDQPAYEVIVSEVAKEIGRQLRIDVRPFAKQADLSMNARRDAAVSLGLLQHIFPTSLIYPVHQAAQKIRVEEGCVGLAVSETFLPGRGWSLRVQTIPADQLVLLPVGVKHRPEVNVVVWDRWVSLKWLRDQVESINTRMDSKRMSVPRKNSEAWERMEVLDVLPGESPRLSGQYDERRYGIGTYMYSDGHASDTRKEEQTVQFVRWRQVYVTEDQRHVSRKIFMIGRYVLDDQTYPQGEEPLMPVAWAVYADVGSPYGRSYAYPKMMATLGLERLLSTVQQNARALRAYGLLAFSTGMNVDLEQLERPSEGDMRTMAYTVDAGAPSQQPFQLAPVPMSKILGNLPQLVGAAAAAVFPDTPIQSGDAPGRVDSNQAIQTLDNLSNVAIKAGAESYALAWAQIYAAGQELADKHYQKGDRIPLILLSPVMAGIVLDTAEVPLSMAEKASQFQRDQDQASKYIQAGVDPFLASAIEGETQQSRGSPRVPLPRFMVGPNVIPHPDTVDIGIRSVMPRDEQREFQELMGATQSGFMSITEMQIRAYIKGLPQELGGEAAINAYELAILNLLSAYGDGVESGPWRIPAVGGDMGIGHWVFQTFIQSTVFALASQEVQQKILEIMDAYAGGNTPQSSFTADEAATVADMRMKQSQMGMGPQNRPQPNGPKMLPQK